MTEFVIYGHLDEDKNLVLQGPTCCQGEHNTTKLIVSLPNALAQEADFYFEFMCPHNLWISPKANVTVGESYTQVEHLLDQNLLRDEGQVVVQLVARKKLDQSVAFKSNLSCESSIWVGKSVNAVTESPKVVDLFGQAMDVMNKTEEKLQTLSDVSFSGSYDDLTNAPQKVSDLPNDAGYLTAEGVIPLVPTNVSQLTNDKSYLTPTTLTPLLPSRVGQLTNDAGYLTQVDVTPQIPTKTSHLTNDTGFVTQSEVTPLIPTKLSQLDNDKNYLIQAPVTSVNGKVGQVTLSAIDVGALPSSTVIPTVNNPIIYVYQEGNLKGSFSLNQASNGYIYLSDETATGSSTAQSGNVYTVAGDVVVIPFESGQAIDLYVTPDLDYADFEYMAGFLNLLYVNGVQFGIEKNKIQHIQFIPQPSNETFYLLVNGVVRDDVVIPMLNPENDNYELSITFWYDVQSGASYNNYLVR